MPPDRRRKILKRRFGGYACASRSRRRTIGRGYALKRAPATVSGQRHDRELAKVFAIHDEKIGSD